MAGQGVGRREFLKAAGAPTLFGHAPSILGELRRPNETIGVAMIGVGARGLYLLDQVQRCPDTEVRVISDLFEPNIRRAASATASAGVRIEKDWRKAIERKDIDAVIIATPDFWHAEMTIAATQLGKDVFTEKGFCRTLAEAKRARQALIENRVVFQLGHHWNSAPPYIRARELYRSGCLGRVHRVHMQANGDWRTYSAYNLNQALGDANFQTADWERFLGAAAPKHAFDAARFFRWRCWWDCGNGIAGDLMSPMWDGANSVMGLGIPDSVVTHGGPAWRSDREVPDAWHVLFDYPSQDVVAQFSCGAHNRRDGSGSWFVGRAATLEVDADCWRVWDAGRESMREGQAQPRYEWKRAGMEVTSHMRNFIDCMRSRSETRCGVRRAWESAVATAMSVESYRRERRVRWDADREEIV